MTLPGGNAQLDALSDSQGWEMAIPKYGVVPYGGNPSVRAMWNWETPL